MKEENIIQKFRLKNTEEIKNELMSKNHEKVCMALNYTEHFLILASAITGFVSISAIASLLGIPIRNTNSAIGLRIFTITASIKKYKSTVKKKKKKHDKIVLSAKTNLNSIELLISEALNNSYIRHNEFV